MLALSKIIGLSGVDPEENLRAQHAGNFFNSMLMLAVILLAIQWNLESHGKLSETASDALGFVVWGFFLIETITLTSLVDQKSRYLRNNWLNLVIIFVSVPLLIADSGPLIMLLRALRLMLLASLLIPSFKLVIHFLTDNRLDTTIAASIMVLILAGSVVTVIDPNINSIGDGIWWALVTISTVGYGDVVPVSTSGRLFAALLIFLGLSLFSILTANISAILMQRRIKKDMQRERREIDEILESLAKLHAENQQLLQQLTDIKKKLD